MLEKYAELIVKQGVNLQPQQELVIESSWENAPLVRAVAKWAYQVGAKDVIVHYSDEVLTRLRYQHCSSEHLSHIPLYLQELRNQYALHHAAFLFIESEDPEALQNIDPMKIQTYQKAVKSACRPFYDGMDQALNRWCIVGAPSVGWANKVFPQMSDQEAVEALWKAIWKVTRCDQEDPIKAWEEHRQSFLRRVRILNEKKIRSLHYQNSLGTDLTIGMNKDYVFAGGGSYTTDGVYSFPNIPTEEIFTSPRFDQVEGIVYSAMPLHYQGHIIDEFWLRFHQGRIVDYGAKCGYDALKSIIETDEGSHYLGEVALVPYDSPIRQMNLLFYHTLFDENAACHLAIGKGFGECLQGGLQMDKQQLHQHGINDSLTHVDFMIGTKDLSICATLQDGETFWIFKEGNFAF